MNLETVQRLSVIKKVIFLLGFIGVFAFAGKSQSVGGITTGGATYCNYTNSGFISLSGYVGGVVTWQSSTNGGITWANISNVTPTQSYSALTQTTCYRAIVQNGSFPPDTSTVSCVNIYAPTNGGTLSGGGTFCSTSGSGTLTLTGSVGSVLNWQYSTDGGMNWTTIADTNTTLNYAPITTSTIYAAVVQNTINCPIDTSSLELFNIAIPTVAGSISSNYSIVCNLVNADTISVNGNNGGVIGWASSTDNGTTWTPIVNTSTSYNYSGLTQTTQFIALVQNSVCAVDTTNILTVTVLAPVSVSAGADVTVAPGQTVTLNGTGTGTILWSPAATLSDSSILNPVASPTATTTYTLTITDANSCVGVDMVVVSVIPPTFDGMISNLFTPNGDGINDAFYIEDVLLYPENEVAIYNIYGNEVFSAKGYKNDWKGTYNGQNLPDGTYFYVVKMDSSGKVFQGALDILSKK